ncbi:MAG: hypothetical protein ABWZ99_06670 [Ilumatobacteraceae bacterium]
MGIEAAAMPGDMVDLDRPTTDRVCRIRMDHDSGGESKGKLLHERTDAAPPQRIDHIEFETRACGSLPTRPQREHSVDACRARAAAFAHGLCHRPERRNRGVVIDDPFREPLETFVVEVASTVEPRSRRTRQPNSVVTLDDVCGRQDVRSSQSNAAGERSAVVLDEHVGQGGTKDVSKVPEIRTGRSADHRRGIRQTCGRAPGFEGVGGGGDSEHALVEPDEGTGRDQVTDRVVADAIGIQLCVRHDAVSAGDVLGE